MLFRSVALVLIFAGEHFQLAFGRENVNFKSRKRPYYDYDQKYDYESNSFLFEVTIPSYTRRILTTRTPRSVRTTLSPITTTAIPFYKFRVSRPRLFSETTTRTFNLSSGKSSYQNLPRGISTFKILKLEIRVPNNEDTNTFYFKQLMANRLSYLLYALQSITGDDSTILGRPYDDEPYIYDILVFGADRKEAGDHVQLDFSVVSNSTLLDADVVANLLTNNVRQTELSGIIGFPVIMLPKAFATSLYKPSNGIGINRLLRLEFGYPVYQKDTFFTTVSDWLHNVIAPETRRRLNTSGNTTIVITKVRFFSDVVALDFSVNLGQPYPAEKTVNEIAWSLFSNFTAMVQQMSNFTILSGGYLDSKVKPKYHVIYNRTAPFQVSNDVWETSTSTTLRSQTTTSDLLIPDLKGDTDQLTRIVFSLPDQGNLTKDSLLRAATKWANTFIGPFVQRAFGTNLNSTVFISTFIFDNDTMAMDFAVLFDMQQFPLIANATEVSHEMFSSYFDIVQASFPVYRIVSGGYLKSSSKNGNITKVFVVVNSTDNGFAFRATPGPMHVPALNRIKMKDVTAALPMVTDSPLALLLSNDSDTAKHRAKSTFSAQDTDQISRIVFEVPTDRVVTKYDMDRSVQFWLDAYVIAFIKDIFGINASLSASASVLNSSMVDNTFILDFAILFSPPPQAANSTRVAITLFSIYNDKTQANSPYKILSGGYMVPSYVNGTLTTYIVVYSLAGQSTWITPDFQPKHLLYMEMRVPTVIDVSSPAFKQLITNRLRGVVLPALQRSPFNDNIFVAAVKYYAEWNIYDVILYSSKRVGGEDREKVGIEFALIANSSLLNGAIAANALGLNMQPVNLQQSVGFEVLTLPTAVTALKGQNIKEPESQLWIIGAVLAPLIVIIILLNVCILMCCRPGQPNPALKASLQTKQGPGTTNEAQNAAVNSPATVAPNYPYLYYYQPVALMPTSQGVPEKEKSVSVKHVENRLMSSVETSVTTASPPPLPPRVSYNFLQSRPRTGRKTRRRIRPMGGAEPDAAVISQVASTLLREAFRNLSVEEIRRVNDISERHHADSGWSSDVADQVCQTEDSQLTGASDKTWTREYEQSLLRLASMVVAPSELQPGNKSTFPHKDYITVPEHGAIVAQVLKDHARLAAEQNIEPVQAPQPLVAEPATATASSAVTDPKVGELMNVDNAGYLDINDTQLKQLERLNALFLSMPATRLASETTTTTATTKPATAGLRSGENNEFADEHDVIVDALRPGVPPRRLLEALRTELERYGRKQ